MFDYIQSATGPFIECPVGITAREKSPPPKTLVQEVTSNEPGVRVFVVHSEERLAFERTQRVKSMNRVRTRLEKLRKPILLHLPDIAREARNPLIGSIAKESSTARTAALLGRAEQSSLKAA